MLRALPLRAPARVAVQHAVRAYATAPVDKQKDLQAKQLRLAEKAGRMKQNIGVLTTIPVFANYVRPRSTRTVPAGIGLRARFDYFKADWGNDVYTLYLRYQVSKALGKEWLKHFTARSNEAYAAANHAFASGVYKTIAPLASTELISDIKGRRSGSLQGLRMSWKLHKLLEHNLCCVRQQEVTKAGEFVAQIAVQFITEQSLEVRDAGGKLIKGDHAQPRRVTEYYVFQRNLWQASDDWKMVKKVMEIDPFGADKDQFIKS